MNTEGKDIKVTAYDRWTKIGGQLVGYEAREMEVAAGVFGVLGRLGYFETEEDRVSGKSSNFQFYITADGARCLAAMLLEKANESDSASQNPENSA